MRLFIAIELSNTMRNELTGLLKALKQRSCGGRFTVPENMHLTVHFIGETDDVAGVTAAMREACRDIRPFTLKAGSYGFFDETPSGNHRVSLVTVEGELSELSILRECLEAALADRGFPRDRKKFIPHITLGLSVEHDELVTAELRSMILSSETNVTGITLFESARIKGKTVYTPLHRERF